MKRAEFEEGIASFNRSLYIPLATAGVGIIAWVVAIAAFHAQLLVIGARLFGAGNSEIIRPALLAPVIVATLVASALAHRPVRNDPRLLCKRCGKFLGAVQTRMIVIATCNCPYCGSQVLDAAPSSTIKPPQLTR